MKHPNETEAEFLRRVEKAAEKGEVIFRDDANREFILDIIDDYMDVKNSIIQKNK